MLKASFYVFPHAEETTIMEVKWAARKNITQQVLDLALCLSKLRLRLSQTPETKLMVG